MMRRFRATSHKSHVTRPTNIFILCLVSGAWCLVPGLCFAQEHSLSYYEVIEKRNFFRPKKEVSSKDKQNKINNAYAKKRDNSLEFVLTGVVRIRGKFKAIIERSSGEGFYVGINESVEDYLVKEIEADKVILSKGGQEFALKLKKATLQEKPNSKKESREEPAQKKESPSATKIKYEPSIIQKLRTGKSPDQASGGKR